MSNKMSDRMLGKLSDRMSERILDKRPEYMSVGMLEYASEYVRYPRVSVGGVTRRYHLVALASFNFLANFTNPCCQLAVSEDDVYPPDDQPSIGKMVIDEPVDCGILRKVQASRSILD